MPTTNPVPSTDPSDLLFNAGRLDEVVNGISNSFTDRLGVSRRTVAGMNADFDAQLADAESDLNIYRADAAASAAEALGYLQIIQSTYYGAYAEDPVTDPFGNPSTVGDEYFNTTANLLKRWNGTTWQASDINTANLAAPSGSSLVGYMPAGTGAVATTAESKLRENVSTYDKLTSAQIAEIKAGTSASDLASAIQAALSTDASDVVIKAGTYLIGPTGINLTDVSDKRVVFEKGAVFKWHPSVPFTSLVKMISLTNCENIEFVNPRLVGANNPSIWVKTEKVIRAGLTDNQAAIYMRGCKNIKFTSPDVRNFQWGIYTLATGVSKTTGTKINDGYLTGNYCGIVWESYVADGIVDCDVHNTRSVANWKWGMWMEAGSTKDSRYIRGIKTSGGSFSEQVEEHGVYVQGQEHSFIGVKFYSNNTAGLRMLACGQLHVIGCKFSNNGWNANTIGYPAGAAFIGDDTSTTNEYQRANNVVIEGNVFIGNRYSFIDYKLDNNVVVANNTCTGNGASGVEGDIVFRSNQNSKITGNVIRNSLCDVGILVRDQGNSIGQNITVVDNTVTGQVGIGIKYSWSASDTDSEMIRIRGNTVKSATSHGIVVELNTRETRFVEVTGNNVQYCGGVGIRIYVGATGVCNFMRVTENNSTQNASYGIEYGGASGGLVYGLLDRSNVVYRNNSNGVQKYQAASGNASYSTNFWVESGKREPVVFRVSGVTPGTGEVQLLFNGVSPYIKAITSGRVKAIEFYASKGITGGSVSAALKTYTGTFPGALTISSSLTATIAAGNQEKYINNAMNNTTDRINLGSRYYVGVDMSSVVVAGGGTVDFLVVLHVDYVDDYRFETVL